MAFILSITAMMIPPWLNLSKILMKHDSLLCYTTMITLHYILPVHRNNSYCRRPKRHQHNVSS